MRTVLIRSAMVAMALLAAGWLVLSFRSFELESDGQELIGRSQRGSITSDELNRVRTRLQSARRFSVDQDPAIIEGVLLDSTGRPDQAAAVAEDVVEDEPDNVDGWIVLYLALSDLKGAARDPRREAEALRMVRRLNPLAADAVRPRR
jgi:hypothetical protein